MNYYSVSEAAKKLNTYNRYVQRKCKKLNVRKIANRYNISENLVNEWRQELTTNDNVATTQTTMSQEYKAFLEAKAESEKLNGNNPKTENRNNKQLDIEVESLKQHIKELNQELQQYEVKENERLEVFTNEEYSIFETRLKEWFTLQKDIEMQQKLFDAEHKGINEIAEHYKNQFEYQKSQNDKILNLHQKLLDTIEAQNKLAIQRNTIEAIDKQIIDKDNWKRKE